VERRHREHELLFLPVVERHRDAHPLTDTAQADDTALAVLGVPDASSHGQRLVIYVAAVRCVFPSGLVAVALLRSP
jgi:hypothetical protein